MNGQYVKRWLYQDQLNPVAELDSAGNVIARYVYGTKVNIPDYIVKGDTTYSVITDHLGSVRMLVNSVTGAVVQRLDYEEFGTTISNSGYSISPFGYAGGLVDQHTGLIRFGVRDYDPRLGRWTAKDPILFAGRLSNLYEYNLNDPINYFDPTGTQIVNLYQQQISNYYNQINNYVNYNIIQPIGTAINNIPVNPTKLASAIGNYYWGVKSALAGGLKHFAAFSTSTSGIGAAWFGTVGSINLTGAYNAFNRGNQQLKEAFNQKLKDANFRNLLGVLPVGTQFDDPGEKTLWEVYGENTILNVIIEPGCF